MNWQRISIFSKKIVTELSEMTQAVYPGFSLFSIQDPDVLFKHPRYATLPVTGTLNSSSEYQPKTSSSNKNADSDPNSATLAPDPDSGRQK
jgi:hypothetical protein